MRIVAGDAEYAGEGDEEGAALDQTQVADWDGEQGAAEESPAAAAPAAEEPATQAGAAEADDDSDDSDDSLDL